jgi:hypothetical protein
MAAVGDPETADPERDFAAKPQEGQERAINDVKNGERTKLGSLNGFLEALRSRGGQVELRGATPVPYEERTVTNYLDIFTLWFCMSCNPLPYVCQAPTFPIGMICRKLS